MTLITGKEPGHWHDQDGRHRMRDPRRLPGWKKAHCNKDEGAYWDHLDAHDNVEPTPDDSPAVATIFETIAAHERVIGKMRELVKAVRQKESEEKIRTVPTTH